MIQLFDFFWWDFISPFAPPE